MSQLTETQPQNLKKGVAYTLGAVLCWSTSGVLVKMIPWNGITVGALRCFFAFIISLFLVKDKKIRFTVSNIVGGFCMAGSSLLLIVAMKMTTSANALILQNTGPLWIIIFSVVFQHKKLTRLDLFASIIIFSGVLLFFIDSADGGQMLGNLLGLLSGVCFGGIFICNGMKGATPQQATLLGHGIASVIGLPFVFAEVTAEVIPWVTVIFLGMFQLGFAYFLLSKGAPHTPPLLGCLLASLEPILNPLWVMLIIGERPSLLATIGIAVVLFGVVSYNILLSKKAKSQG